MNLNFMTNFPPQKFPPKGKPTNFVPKILACVDTQIAEAYTPKLHTFREKKKRRWKVGDKLHMMTGSRFKPRQFNKDIDGLQVVKGVQDITIIWESPENHPAITIDGKTIPIGDGYYSLIAQNDGFDSLFDFMMYFNQDFEGQIIHWTDLKY